MSYFKLKYYKRTINGHCPTEKEVIAVDYYNLQIN